MNKFSITYSAVKPLLFYLAYTILYYALNYSSSGNLERRLREETVIYQTRCSAYEVYNPARLVCYLVGIVIFPWLVTSTLMFFILLEYGLIGLNNFLRFICGSWCDVVK